MPEDNTEAMVWTGLLDGSAAGAENPGIRLDKAGRLLETRPPLARILLTAATLLVGTVATSGEET